MYKHLCLPWKGVYQSSSIRGWHLFGRSESNICLMYVGTSLVYTLYKSSNKLVHLHPIITNITDFKGIIKVNMSCKKDFKTHIKRKNIEYAFRACSEQKKKTIYKLKRLLLISTTISNSCIVFSYR